jgi:hypothetical protein
VRNLRPCVVSSKRQVDQSLGGWPRSRWRVAGEDEMNGTRAKQWIKFSLFKVKSSRTTNRPVGRGCGAFTVQLRRCQKRIRSSEL